MPFIQGALFSTMNAGTDLARDIQTGFFSRLSLTPVRGGALLAGQLAGIVVLGVLQAVFYITCGLLLGVHFAAGAAGIALLLVYAALVAVGFGAIGSCLALRTGSGEAIQGLFPLLFVFLFISSMNTPRNLIAVGWFQFLASINPISYLIECVRSLIITRLGRARPSRSGSAIAIVLAIVAVIVASREMGTEARAGMNIWPVASGVAWRTLKNVITTPSLVIPSLMFPLLFFIAFAGGLSQVQNTPGFDYPNGYTAFQFVFVLLQSAAFGGVFTGLRRRAGLRGRLRAPAAARGAEPDRDRGRLLHGGAPALVHHRHAPDDRSPCSPGCRSAAGRSTSSASTRSP